MGIRQETERAWENVLSPMFEEFSTEVMINEVDTAATEKDPLYDEPAATRVYTTPIAVRARVKLKQERLTLVGGEEIETDGRVTIRTDELQEKGLALPLGSRIEFGGERFVVVQKETRAEVGDAFLLTRVMVKRETG